MNRYTRTVLGAVALAAVLVVSGCTTNSGASAPQDSGNDSSTTAETQAAQAIVDQVTQQVNEFVPPGPAFNTSGITSGTVYYIVPALEAAVFQTYAELFKEALEPFGLNLQQCGANGGDPATISNCLQQAIDGDAAAVIAMVVPYQLAPTAFDSVTSAGIPLLYALTAPTGPGDPTKVAYFSPDYIGIQSWNSSFVIADSDAKADVLVLEETDNPSVQAWTEQGTLPAYAEGCTGCTVKLLSTSTSQLDKLTTDVTAALVANPNIRYISSPSATYLSAAIAGAQAAGRTATDTLVTSMDVNVSDLTQLQQSQWLAASVGTDFGAATWYMSDQILRMLAGQPSLQNIQFPYQRLFTRDNVSGLEATEAAWVSGDWYTTADYRAGFRELWGK